MKRILSTLVLLTMVLAATADDEELWVAGTKLDLKKTYSQEYLNGDLGGGYFYYSPSANKLTLVGVTIKRSGDGKNGIDCKVAGLKVVFQGINSIQTSAACIKLQANTTIENEGSVTLNCTGSNEGIYIMNTTTINIFGGTWNIKSPSGTGIEGKDKNQTVKIFDNTTCPFFLTVNGKNGCILDLMDLFIYDGLDVCEPIRNNLNTDYIWVSVGGGYYRYKTALFKSGTTTVINNQDVVIGTPAFELGGHGYTIHTTSVTNENITGSVSYNHSTRTLTMNGATTTTGCFVPKQDGMKLLVAGTSKLSSGNGNSISLDGKNLTIQGTNTAKLESGAIRLGGQGTLSITNGVTVNIKSYNVGYPGISFANAENELSFISQDSDPHVIVNGSTLNISSANKPCITAGLQLIGSVVGSPANAVLCCLVDQEPVPSYITPGALYLYNNDMSNYLTGDVSITTGTAYNLWVNSVQVNSRNCSNLNTVVASGSCSYSHSSKQLSLSSVSINNPVGFCIYNSISGLNIVSTGTNTLKTTSTASSIKSTEDFTISGSGHLKASSSGYSGIYVTKTLTISNTEVTASGTYAILGSYDNNFANQNSWSKVYVNNSKLHLTGSTQAIDVGIFDPENNCYIVSPSGGVKVLNTISNADYTPAKTVELRPMVKYNLWINGTQVNEINYSSLHSLDPDNFSGTMTFTPSTNTLKLNAFNTSSDYDGGDTFIKSTLSSLKIELAGDSHIFGSSSQEGFNTTGSVEFCGTGSIEFRSQQKPLYVGGRLVLSGQAALYTTGYQYGISTRSLTMSAGTFLRTIAANTDGKSLIIDSSPSLTGVALPSTMYYNSSLKCIAYKNTGAAVTRDYVKINSENVAQISTDINEITPAEEAGETSIYTTSGTLVWQGAGQPQLPRGIYIMKKNGKVQKVQKN